MKTAIMTDTNCGIMEQEAQEYGICSIPMPVIIDDETYYEGTDIDSDAFFAALYSNHAVSTSQPSPADLMGRWNQLLRSGYDEIVYIPMSSGLSHSCETAATLALDFDGKVFVADNHRISIMQWVSALQAKKLADAGQTGAQIREYLEQTAYDNSIYIAVDTLEFLKRGGRVTPMAAAVGTLLSIKPVLTIQGDKLDAFTKVRGLKKSLPVMADALKRDIETRFGGDENQVVVAMAGAGLTDTEIETYKTMLQSAFPQQDIKYYPLPLSICVHTGRGAIGTGIYKKF